MVLEDVSVLTAVPSLPLNLSQKFLCEDSVRILVLGQKLLILSFSGLECGFLDSTGTGNVKVTIPHLLVFQ